MKKEDPKTYNIYMKLKELQEGKWDFRAIWLENPEDFKKVMDAVIKEANRRAALEKANEEKPNQFMDEQPSKKRSDSDQKLIERKQRVIEGIEDLNRVLYHINSILFDPFEFNKLKEKTLAPISHQPANTSKMKTRA